MLHAGLPGIRFHRDFLPLSRKSEVNQRDVSSKELMATSKAFTVQARAARKTICNYVHVLILTLAGSVSGFVPIPDANADDSLVAQTSTSTEDSSTFFKDKTVRSIKVVIRNIFEGDDLGGVYKAANQFKVSTKEHVIRQELLFSEGDKIDEFLIKESVRNLRQLRYLRHVQIVPKVDGEFIDVVVSVQDTWTLIPQLGFSSGTGKDRFSFGVGESDLLGYGKRFELLFSDEDQRQSIETVWDDRRVMGSDIQLLVGAFDRNDGERFVGQVGKPFRSLVDRDAWVLGGDYSDTIGRLFEAGDESFIFRAENVELDFRYTVSRGNPEVLRRRYSYGFAFQETTFTEADAADFDDLNLDPRTVNQDPSQLADDRRFSGPLVGFDITEPNFISRNYIDRFDRVEDYNLGLHHSFTAQIAPEFLGSADDALLVSASSSRGQSFSYNSFLRGELGMASRIGEGGLDNSLYRGELKYYNVLGQLYLLDLPLGKHTLAAAGYLDYGDDLDLDRQLRLGADNSLRGYTARTFTGDKRFALNFEDRIHIADDIMKLVSLGAAGFVDIGGATYDPLGDLLTDNVYSDVGVGLRIAFPRSSGGRILRMDVAFPLRDGPDGSGEYEPRFIISGGQTFDSFLRSESVGSERASVAVGFDR